MVSQLCRFNRGQGGSHSMLSSHHWKFPFWGGFLYGVYYRPWDDVELILTVNLETPVEEMKIMIKQNTEQCCHYRQCNQASWPQPCASDQWSCWKRLKSVVKPQYSWINSVSAHSVYTLTPELNLFRRQRPHRSCLRHYCCSLRLCRSQNPRQQHQSFHQINPSGSLEHPS